MRGIWHLGIARGRGRLTNPIDYGTKSEMELTPGERAILSQLRDLYTSTTKLEHPLQTITSQWLPPVFEAYKGVLSGLVAKGFLRATNKGRAVEITAEGLKAMGVRIAAESPAQSVPPSPPRRTVAPQLSAAGKRDSRPARHGEPGRKPRMIGKVLGLLATAALAGWLAWRFF